MSADAWIKMRTELTFDPAVVRIAATIGHDEFSVVGRLHAVWSWLDKHSPDGTNVPVTSAFLDRLAACPGFADAMRAVVWLAGRDGALNFPNYARHNGPTAKARAAEAKRKAEQRKRDNPGDNGPALNGTMPVTNVPLSPGLEERRKDKRGEEGRALARDPAHPPIKAKESESDWLARLRAAHPGIDVDAEIAAARVHRRKAGRRLDRAWFERHWLVNCGETVSEPRAPDSTEPEGWRDYIVRNYPQCRFVEGGRCTAARFDMLPGDVQRECRERLKKAS